jgi:hypothetical protein
MKGIIGDIVMYHFGSIEIDIENNRTKVVLNEQPQRFVFPEDTQVVTIKARAYGGLILASFSNDIVTDESWNCTDSSSCPSGGCSNPKWENAVTFGKNEDSSTWPWGKHPEIASSAQWIWINDPFAQSVWCKRTFGRFKYCVQNCYSF